MNAVVTVKPPRWYWVVSVLALIWMLFGVMAWVMDLMMDEAALAEVDPVQRELYEQRPQWLLVLYAIAILSGLLGAIALLIRRSWAVHAFAVSLVAAIIQFGYVWFGMRAIERLGAAQALSFPIVVLAIGALLLWFAIYARKRGWFTA